jgi:hypothetical protein
MLRLLFTIIVPLCILIAPILLLVAYHKTTKERSRKDFIVMALCSMLIGLITPVLAMMVSIYGFSIPDGTPDPYCLTGAGSFIFFGYFISLFGIPITSLILLPRLTPKK